ncbi:TetR/AcrR family transcriptional regulator [Tomitella biformata]|uniref:TetR/AcrR family transcriptional regulator n=1 Tax=Tomitella biformata TaxID=630403 RepID=UPI0004B83ACA|nr:TetR/AcrR family transcriptional regulator [Tomitella biformata]
MVEVKCESGLRARKKAATRGALSDAAARLARDHGLEAVTVEAIAEAAGVSTRTFHNYFSSKEEAMVAYGERIAQQWADALLARPADEQIWDSLEAVLRASFQGADDVIAGSRATVEAINANPLLLARKVDLEAWAQDLLCRAIAERTGTNADTDLYPRLVNLTACSAGRAAAELWASGNAGDRSLDTLIRDGLAQVRAGLPDPSATTGQDS